MMRMNTCPHWQPLWLAALLLLAPLASTATVPAQQRRTVRSSDPNVLAAENYLKQQNYAKAAQALELSLVVDARGTPEVFAMLADARLKLGNKSGAVEICERGLALHPAATKLKEFYIALLTATLGKEELRAKLEEQLTKTNAPIFQKTLGQLLLRENPLDSRAEQLLSAAAKRLPRDPEAHYFYGQWACLNNNEALCVAELTRALSVSGDNNQAKMQIYTMIGMAEDKSNRLPQAEAAFRSAWLLNRGLVAPHPPAALQYAEFLSKHARDAEASKIIDEVLVWAPWFGLARFERAKLLAKQRKMEEAIGEAEAGLRDAMNNKTQLRAMHAFLAKTYFALGRLEEAKIHQNWIESQP